MIAVIYRGFIFPELEDEYQRLWKQIVNHFVTHCGAVGSSLHKTVQNEYIAYSRWPNYQTRDAAWGEAQHLTHPPAIEKAIQQLKKCIDLSKPYDEICMDVVEDFLH